MSFQQAVEALYPGEPAWTLNYEKAQGGRCRIMDLRQVADPASQLYPFVTWSVPNHVSALLLSGQMVLPREIPDWEIASLLRHKIQDGYGNPWNPAAPIVVVEIDYLLLGNEDPTENEEDGREDGEVPLARVQAQALGWALQASGFPYSVLIDSGNKSIHAVIRLSDDSSTLLDFRNNPQSVIEALALALGTFDVGVFKTAGKYRLVRAPGALRTPAGPPQAILAVNPQPIHLRDITQWCMGQLRPEVAGELATTPPAKPGTRKWHLRLPLYRAKLTEPWVKGGRGTRASLLNLDLAMAGIRNHDPQRPPTFLWAFTGAVVEQLSGGWWFSQRPEDQDQQKYRTYELGDVEAKLRDQDAYDRAHGRNPVVQQLVNAFQHVPERTEGAIPVPEVTEPQVPRPKGAKTKEFDPSKYVDYLLATVFHNNPLVAIASIDSTKVVWKYYNGKYWEKIPPGEVERQVIQHALGYKAGCNQIDAVMRHLKARCLRAKDLEYNPDVVVFENGTLEVDHVNHSIAFHEGEFLPDDYAPFIIPHAYHPGAQCPRFLAWLEQMQPDARMREFLCEWVGYILSPGSYMQKWVLMEGSGANGKSVFMSILWGLLGSGACAATTLSELGTDLYSLADLYDKLLVTDADVEPKAMATLASGSGSKSSGTILKRWVSGDPVPVKRKHLGALSLPMLPKLLCSCNDHPTWLSQHADDAFWRRALLVPWGVKIPEEAQDRTLDRKLLMEAEGIIAWGIRGLMRLLKTGVFTVTEEMKAAAQDMRISSDTVLCFVNYYVTASADGVWCSIDPVYKAYQEYVRNEGNHPLSKRNFVNLLRKHVAAIGGDVSQPYAGEGHPVPRGEVAKTQGRYNWCYRKFKCTHSAMVASAPTGLIAMAR